LDLVFLERIRGAVREVEPDAQITLYGSRARGAAAPESDWDLLVLLDGPVDPGRAAAVRYRLYELEWETGAVLTSAVLSKQEWDSSLWQAMPFHASVDQDGIRL
jgi:predicted nucleotidyltransferase